jgi:hypothetical protein
MCSYVHTVRRGTAVRLLMPFVHYRLRRSASTSIKNPTSGGGVIQLSKGVEKYKIKKAVGIKGMEQYQLRPFTNELGTKPCIAIEGEDRERDGSFVGSQIADKELNGNSPNNEMRGSRF